MALDVRTDAQQPLIIINAELKYWASFLFPGCDQKIDTTWIDVLTTAVEVTDGRSTYDPIRGHLKINQEQTIASFFSELLPQPVRTNLYRETSSDSVNASSNIFPERIAIGQGQKPSLFISFVRTVRVPEDGSEYDLPPNTGLFPIFKVQDFGSQLPVSMVAKGGLCIPMQCESRSPHAVISMVYSDRRITARYGSDVDPF